MMERLIVVTTTSDDRDKLEEMAAYLVDHRLAACCQVAGPISSWYRWQGQTESSQEWTCTIKTVKRLFPDVCAAIVQLHHYEQPQIVAVDIVDASQGYHNWIVESVKPA